MTNYEKLEPSIKILFGDGWTPETFAHFYADAMDVDNCEGCIVGEPECTHRMGQKTYEELMSGNPSEEEQEEWWGDTGNGKVCEDVLLEYLLEESN